MQQEKNSSFLETYVLTGGVYQLASKLITQNSVVENNNHSCYETASYLVSSSVN